MDFDLVLEEIGEFGKFQLTNYLLICLPVLYAAANSLSYVFTARTPNYRFEGKRNFQLKFYDVNFRRCLVPECESLENAKYDAEWVKDVLPGSISDNNGIFQPEICSKFIFKNDSAPHGNDSCPAHWFDHEEERCSQWVFDKSERTVVNDVSYPINFLHHLTIHTFTVGFKMSRESVEAGACGNHALRRHHIRVWSVWVPCRPLRKKNNLHRLHYLHVADWSWSSSVERLPDVLDIFVSKCCRNVRRLSIGVCTWP